MVALLVTLGLTVGNAPKRAVTEPGAARDDSTSHTSWPRGASGVPGSLTATSRGLYRHHSAAYWAWRYKQRTRQVWAERAKVKLLKRRLRERHNVTRRVASSGYGVWDRLADCESGGNWADTAGSFEGGLQFLNSTWLAHGGGVYAAHAYSASREQQIVIAERVLADQGWQAWPACSAELGLR